MSTSRASLVADLHRVMAQEPLSPFIVETWRVEALADRLLRAGWRRVTEDPVVVDRVARAVHDAECGIDDLCKGYDSHGEYDRVFRPDSYTAIAHAVLAVLRSGADQ